MHDVASGALCDLVAQPVAVTRAVVSCTTTPAHRHSATSVCVPRENVIVDTQARSAIEPLVRRGRADNDTGFPFRVRRKFVSPEVKAPSSPDR